MGTDQLPTSEAPEEDDNVEQLLTAIGLNRLLQRGARVLPRYQEDLPPPAAASEQPLCSWRSVQHLQAILAGHHGPALPEFAHLLSVYKKQLPHTALPELLDQAHQQPERWQLIAPILGERGLWLLRQHPDWSVLLPDRDTFEDWYTAPPAQQPRLLRAYRQDAPDDARQSLTDHWLEFDHKQQAQLLPAIQENLDPADEPFLEHCRLAKRKDVRLAASELLANLPESELSKRCWKHAQAALSMSEKSIELVLPEKVPKITQGDGIYPTGSKMPGGLRLNWLLQLLERIPFSRWATHWQKPPLDILQRLAKATYGTQLLQALTQSLLRHPDLAGTEAMIKWWLLSDQQSLWNQPSAKALLKKASPAFFNASLLTWLQQFGPLVPQDTLPAYWLLHSPHPWQPALSKMVVLGFRDVIQGRRTANWDLYHYRPLLEKAAYQSDPELFHQFKTGWSFREEGLGTWHADLEKMLQILHFRLDMKAELKK